ncbi:MAG: alpha/beta hydrolase [Flavobacteriaceae bacterium]|nr:alpha/beta hydrolase [Flavobacteriaceae bacterium]
MKKLFYILFLLSFTTFNSNAQEKVSSEHEEVIYARKHGMALTMVVLKPEKTNGKAIVSVVSGNWISSYSKLSRKTDRATPFLESGYTVFMVMHGSSPRFDLAEAATDIKHAVQYIRYNAKKFGIDPDHIGITGSSSGGHLSLVVGTSDDLKDPKSRNPVRQVSSKVQAVAVFYPPTDFLNWWQPNTYFNHLEHEAILTRFRILGAMRFQVFDSKDFVYKPIKDSIALRKKSISVSPAQIVTLDDAPTYIIHGDKDTTVPLQQSQILQKNFDSIGVKLTLIVKPEAGHGWKNMNEDRKEFVKWFDKYLKVK